MPDEHCRPRVAEFGQRQRNYKAVADLEEESEQAEISGPDPETPAEIRALLEEAFLQGRPELEKTVFRAQVARDGALSTWMVVKMVVGFPLRDAWGTLGAGYPHWRHGNGFRKDHVTGSVRLPCDHPDNDGRSSPNVEVIDLAPGLWIWRLEHPAWNPQVDWQEVVTCTCVDAGDERWLLDPLLPPDDATQVWDRLAERPPTAVAVLLADHLRETWSDRKTWSMDGAVRRYGCRAFGPDVWDPHQGRPEKKVQKIQGVREARAASRSSPGGPGTRAGHPVAPGSGTLVFGDALTERRGALRVWMSPTHNERALPDLRAMLDLPFERVIISHGEPLHTREAFERALELPPWPATPLHQAAYGGNFERVRSLVEAGADMTARDELSRAAGSQRPRLPTR